MAITFLGIDHIGIAVHDLEAARKTYRDVLGFSICGGETLPDRGLEVAFVNPGASDGAKPWAPRIELIAPTRDQSEVSGFLQKRGEGIHHICMRVGDIHAAITQLRAQGAHVLGDGPRRGAHGRLVAFIHPKASHGVLIELVQHEESEIEHD